jgi:hypothetical protein
LREVERRWTASQRSQEMSGVVRATSAASALSWPFNADETIALLIGVPGTIAAVIAAIFAVRADWFVRKDSATNALLRDADVQPRLHEAWGGKTAPTTHNFLSLTNVGGSATHFIWVGIDDQYVGAASGTIGPHTPSPANFVVAQLGESSYSSGRGTLLLVAQDVQERWWDCRSGLRLPMAVEEYLAQRMKQVGLAELEPQMRHFLPRKMPPQSLKF